MLGKEQNSNVNESSTLIRLTTTTCPNSFGQPKHQKTRTPSKRPKVPKTVTLSLNPTNKTKPHRQTTHPESLLYMKQIAIARKMHMQSKIQFIKSYPKSDQNIFYPCPHYTPVLPSFLPTLHDSLSSCLSCAMLMHLHTQINKSLSN